MMDTIHLTGISMILRLQDWLQNVSGPLLFFSHIGSPPLSFTFFFPVAYCIHPSIGKRIMWVAVIAEWLNAVFKWILHGERPYWWVHETNLYPSDKIPHLKQFNITCETGPGSPSGHAMVSSAVIYIFVSNFIQHYEKRTGKWIQLLCWSAFTIVVVGNCVSRLFIAAHFPHQVVAGFITGVSLAYLFDKISIASLELRHYFITTASLAAATLISYYSLLLLNFDPNWSVAMAIRWCALKEWIHLNTSTFYAIVRDLANLLGLGVATWIIRNWKVQEVKSFLTIGVQIILSVTLASMSDRLKISNDYIPVFYLLGFLKSFFTVFVVVIFISASNSMSFT